VLIEDGDDAGVALRGLFIISPTGILRQVSTHTHTHMHTQREIVKEL
jgi:alkyl hydroperoxide reductase subunit AhpC